MRYKVISTVIFNKWLAKLKDRNAVKAIKGYRIYFTVQNEMVVTLLCGGIKSNKKQQQRDIRQAKRILGELED